MERTIHQGRNVKRFREMLGIKQESLAHERGEDWNQRKVSLLEGKETIEDDIIEKVAEILKIPSEAIKHFDDKGAVNIIANTFQDKSVAYASSYQWSFDPLQKIIDLYDHLVQTERDKSAVLKEILEKLILIPNTQSGIASQPSQSPNIY